MPEVKIYFSSEKSKSSSWSKKVGEKLLFNQEVTWLLGHETKYERRKCESTVGWWTCEPWQVLFNYFKKTCEPWQLHLLEVILVVVAFDLKSKKTIQRKFTLTRVVLVVTFELEMKPWNKFGRLRTCEIVNGGLRCNNQTTKSHFLQLLAFSKEKIWKKIDFRIKKWRKKTKKAEINFTGCNFH